MAKVFGQLEIAQLENVSGNPGSALAVGRVWVDITNPTRGVPKYYDGNTVRNFDVENFNPIGNSGSSLTIDWSLSTTQSLTLTGNCVITHSNMPTNGKVCTLIVSQASSVPLFKIRFPTDNYWQKKVIPDVIPANATQRFQFLNISGFLAAVTSLGSYNAPSTNSVSAIAHMTFSPDGLWAAFCDGSTNLKSIGVFQGALGGLNWGSVGSTATAAGNTSCVAWHPSGAWVAVASATSPFVQVFPVSSGVFGPAIPNPGALPPAAVTGVAWSPTGDALLWVGGTTPFIGGWPFTNGVFGTVYSNPGTAAQASHSVKFHPGGLFVALGLDAAPGVAAYAFTSSGGFGSKSAAPSPSTFLTSQVPDAISFSPDGAYIAVANTATPFIHVWPFSAGGAFGTVVANPGTLPASQVFGIFFSPYNDYLFGTTQTGATVLYAYPWTGVFGTLGTNATTLPPTTNLFGCSVHPSGDHVAWYGNTTPFMGIYAAPHVVKNVIASQM